jgi:lipopolysaccharide transport system ATP-binding protein
MRVAVRAEGLSKRYRLGAGVHGRLTEVLWDVVGRPVRSLSGRKQARPDYIWALKDVSFEISEGEVVGFIGRNGAGKSTLLKILSRITEPTEGFADIEGRVGSLIEVGSGFHPDLTGRENVYLYGAVLGMRKGEVARKFDEIVSFAEVERFIETPVKRYSSGMYMRLAFAVAAHLEPEILIVDEVLSVGDFAFQKKCLGKMEQVASGGRTVLFVSQNTSTVASLCGRAYLLDQGRIVAAGPAPQVVQTYVAAGRQNEAMPIGERLDRKGDGSVRVTSLRIENANGGGAIGSSSPVRVTLDYESQSPVRSPRFQVILHDEDYYGLYHLDTNAEGDLPDLLPAHGTVTCITDPVNLTAGRCGLTISVHRAGRLADYVTYAGAFEVHADGFYASGRMPTREDVFGLLHHRWRLATPVEGDA